MRIENHGHEIRSIDDWFKYAPPKSGKRQWIEGRSAFELAQAWCAPDGCILSMPAEMRVLLDSRPETAGMVGDRAYPEHRIRFDEHGGEPRNADLAFVGTANGAGVAVTVEAKADEPFGATIADTAAAALERCITNPRSRGVERITDLVTSLLPPWKKGLPHVGGLHYQLLTAVAGTLAYAIDNAAQYAVLVVHEFVTAKTKDERHAFNAKAYCDFLHRLQGERLLDEEADGLAGPFKIPGAPNFSEAPPLLIGKVSTNCRKEVTQ
jgi:hypothetical protein